MSICILLIVSNINRKNDEKLVKQIFGIDITKYKVLEKKNTLSDTRYGGEGNYKLIIEVKKEQMDTFLSTIQNEQYASIENGTLQEKDINIYRGVARNISGWDAENIESIYMYLGSPKRNIKSTVIVMSAESWVIVKKSRENIYEVCLWYYG